MAQLLRTIILFENKNFSGGIGSEKWYFPFSSDAAAITLMNQLGTKRATILGLGAVVRAVRGEVVDLAPNGAPVRNHTLPSQGLLTGGYSPDLTGTFTGFLSEQLVGSRNAGPTLALTYPGSTGGTRYETLTLAPRGSYADLRAMPIFNNDATRFIGNTKPDSYYQMVRAYFRFLVNSGASVLVRKPTTTKYAIMGVTSGNPVTPVLATVTVMGDQTAVFTPGIKAIVSQRRAPRGLGQAKSKELNGTHSVMTSAFSASTNSTTIALTCTIGVTVDLCRSSGFIRPAEFSTNTLGGLIDVFVQVRGRRSRKNVVQI